jgi:2-hydroxychromene-2-carboxylate isomerase
MKIEIHFDFGSPNAYLSHLVIPEIENRVGVKFDYIPVLLGGVFKATGNASPAQTLQGIRNKGDYQGIETARFLRKHNITNFNRNPFFPVNTLQLMRGATFAKSTDYFEQYVDEVYRHMWCDPKKMDDMAVFQQALEESALPVDEIMAGIQDPAVKQQLIANTEQSVERGTFGSPTFYVDDEIFFGKDKLRDAEEQILSLRQA